MTESHPGRHGNHRCWFCAVYGVRALDEETAFIIEKLFTLRCVLRPRSMQYGMTQQDGGTPLDEIDDGDDIIIKHRR